MNALLAGGATLIALGGAELAVRLVAPQQLVLVRPDIWMPADTVGWLAQPNVHTTVNTGERTVELFTDSSGFRIGKRGRVESSHRVLVMGDSFMEALQVAYEQSLSGLLEARLPPTVSFSVAVRDAGVDGWDPPQYYLRTRTLLSQDRYDAILVSLYLGNDIVDRWPRYFPPRHPMARHHLHVPRHFTRREWVDGLFYPIDDYLKVHSQLFVLLKTRLQVLLMRLGLSAEYFPVEFYRSDAGSQRWSLTADICAALAAEARARGTPVVFVMIPAPFQVEREQFQQYVRGLHIDSSAVDLEQPNRLVGAALRRRGLVVLDALEAMRAAHRGGVDLYGHVDRHLSPAGHDAVERFVEPALARLLTERERRRLGE